MSEILKLYDYQEECVKILDTKSKGIVCLPTGTGKTLIQATIIANDIIQHPNTFNLYVINAPRIMLSYQLMKEVYSYLVNNHIEARYMCVHSGGQADMEELEKIRVESNQMSDETIPFSEIENGTSPALIREMILKAKNQNLPLVLFSTYNSADRIEDARFNITVEQEKEYTLNTPKPLQEDFGYMDEGCFQGWVNSEDEDAYLDELRKWERQNHKSKLQIPVNTPTTYDKIEIVVNDEAHYLIQERFYNILEILKSNRCYFFTATTINSPSDKGRGMNNVESYGEIIYMMTPREAIDRGKMVRPRLHFLLSYGTTYTINDYETSLGVIIEESFLQHQYVLKGVNPKVLVSVKGVGDIKRFFEGKEYKKMIRNGTTIYAVASDESIGNDINGEKVTRQVFLNRLKIDGRDRSKRLVVLHYDILAEGIDISGFTGILPLRTLTKSKFLQTYGRAARLDYDDRQRLESGEIKPNDLSEFVKPYAWVIVPAIIHENADNKEHIGNLITELRSYGFSPTDDVIITDDTNGLPTVMGPESLNQLKKKSPNIGSYIEKVEAEYEDERIAQLNETEWLDKVINDLKD